MRSFSKLIVLIVILLGAVLLFAPPLIGLGIDKISNSGLIFDKSKVQVISYHRGWFSSDVTSKVTITDPDLRSLIEKLGISAENSSDTFELTVEQHIQHGPIFYLNTAHLPYLIGLAAIDRKFLLTPAQQSALAALGIKKSVLKVNKSYWSFAGNCFDYFDFNNFNLTLPNGPSIQFNSLQSGTWYKPSSPWIKGKVVITDFKMQEETTFLMLPNITATFDMQQDANGLWIGDQTLSLSAIALHDSGTQILKLNEVQLSGSVNETRGLLDVDKQFSIEKLQSENKLIGPFHLKLGVKRLNAKAINDLITIYEEITHRGELYESQLKQNIISQLPFIVAPGTKIQLSDLGITTPEGQLQLSAKVDWPRENFIPPQNLREMIQTAKFEGNFRIAKPLANEVIKLFSKLIYFYQIPKEDRVALVTLRDDMNLNMQQKSFVIISLIQAKQLPKQEGLDLLAIIRGTNTTDDFNFEVKKLLMNRKINREIAYWLGWQYNEFNDQKKLFNAEMINYQLLTEKQFQLQIKDLIQKGYILLDNNDYVVSMVRENGIAKINGKVIQ